MSRTHAVGIVIKIHDRYNDLPPIWDKLRRKIDSVRATMPSGVKQLVFNDEFGEVFGIIVTLAGAENHDGEIDISFSNLQAHARKLRGELLRLEEVAKVELIGTRKERITAAKNRARFAEFAGIVKAIGWYRYQVRIRWGGDWDGDNDLDDQTFDDLVHFELVPPRTDSEFPDGVI